MVLSGVRQVGSTEVGGQISASPMVDDSGLYKIAFTWVEQPFGSSSGSIKAKILSNSLN